MRYIRIVGALAFVELTRGQEAKIDLQDLELVKGRSWHAIPNGVGGFYARASSGAYMHRLITKCPGGEEVDHWNHDTLDNTRANLRVGTHKANMENGRFALATHCPMGHEYTEANTYLDGKGRRCRRCNAERVAEIYASETVQQRENRRKRVRAYQHANREEIREKNRQYALEHKAEKAEYDRRRYQMKKKAK